MKKTLLALITCICMLFAFAACGSGETTEDSNTESTQAYDKAVEEGFLEPSYEDVMRHHEDYEAQKVVLSGRVIQVFGDEEEEGNVLRMDCGMGDYVLVQYKSALSNETPIVDDYVSAWGTFNWIESNGNTYPMIDVTDPDTDELYIDLDEE